MALQRKNFRCPRDGWNSPLPTQKAPGLVISHAELPPRQRKRLQVGSTNLSRSVSTPELSTPKAINPRTNADEEDISAAARRICETNIELIKASRATTSSDDKNRATMALERRRNSDLAVYTTQWKATMVNADNGKEVALRDGDSMTESPGKPHPGERNLNNPGEDHIDGQFRNSAELRAFLATRQKLYDAFVARYGSVRAVFRAFDNDANGMISSQRFKDMIEASEVELTPNEMSHMFQHVDLNGDNTIEFQEFAEMFTATHYAELASAFSPTRDTSLTSDPSSSFALKFRAPLDLSPRARERMKELRLKVNGELQRKHGRDVSVHGGKTENLLIYAFKQFDQDNDGFLSYDQVKNALGKEYLQLEMSPGEMDEMVRLIDRNSDEKISMKEFVQYLGAGDRELPTDLIDNGRKKELAALHFKGTVALTPREEVDPGYLERRNAPSSVEKKTLPVLESSGCMQEQLSRRIATSPVFRIPPQRAKTSAVLTSSRSTPTLEGISSGDGQVRKKALGPTLNPITLVSQDRFLYWRLQRTDWSRVGVGGDGVHPDTALFGNDFSTTAKEAFSPIHRGVNSGDVFRDQIPTSTAEAAVRESRRQARFTRTQALLEEMEATRLQDERLTDWKGRAKVRQGAERRFLYLDRIHDQENRVAMREQQMQKRHGGVRFHHMWAGSPDSQFNRQDGFTS
ncbi:hypothetical protein Poli38472_002044 [Pythium oligandrum]|uniref:EF-hand domain-containing protein n=1 Tax=Pythium oligandrum TaxID=41045 RepID=A0A8K1FLW8_PYTOL|nr:hypothetical protein Poli38472_002044 [Pythium oligandrum]|eukprot:TMW63103.1 hypothetical protein Poli38472_002044 [Pythium oligandrum]